MFHGVADEMRTHKQMTMRPIGEWPPPNGGSPAQGSLGLFLTDVTDRDGRDCRQEGVCYWALRASSRQRCPSWRWPASIWSGRHLQMFWSLSPHRDWMDTRQRTLPLAGLAAGEIPWLLGHLHPSKRCLSWLLTPTQQPTISLHGSWLPGLRPVTGAATLQTTSLE